MQINDLYKQYKNRSVKKIDAETKDNILKGLSSINCIDSFYDANKFIEILALCRGAQVAMDGEKRNNTFRTLLSTGEEGAYFEDDSYINDRFMYELIQNVDDCKYASINDCKLNIDFDLENDCMVLKYNETGFRPKDVIAISDIGNSTKNHHKSLDQKESGLDKEDLQEIGEKGIGFKSIFGLANKVTIQSGYFNFYFDYTEFTIPKVLTEIPQKKIDGTILTLYLKSGVTRKLFKMLEEKYKDNKNIINQNPVLFLNKLTEIKYVCKDGYFGFRVSRNNGSKNVDGELINIDYLSSNRNESRTIECYRYSKEIQYTIEECRSRFGKDEDKERKYKIEIITLANLKESFEGRLYSFFPTTQKLTVPMIIQAPFKLTTGRTNIANQGLDGNNLWYLKTKTETINFVYHVLEDLCKKIGYKIINFIPDINIVQSEECRLYDSRLGKDDILKLNLFESIDGDYYPANEVYFLNKEGITLDDSKDIYELLNLYIPLLNHVIKNINYEKWYGFKRIDNVDEKLFRVALEKPQYTERCLSYLKNYDVSNFIGDDEYTLTPRQITLFNEYPKIIYFINEQTIQFLKNNKSIDFHLNTCLNIYSKDLESIKAYCKQNDDMIDERILKFVENVSCDQNKLWNEDIILRNCIFTNNIIESFNKLFSKIDKKFKNFFSFIRYEEVEKRINTLILDNQTTEHEFLNEIFRIRTEQRKILGKQYTNIFSLINQSGTKPQRFLMELLQNIDDCDYNEDPYVDIQYDNRILEITYNEVGFTKENVVAITAIGDSTKQYLTNNTYTGEKGIGFKSIFNIANSVEIYSNEFNFSLSENEPTIPKRIKTNEFIKGTKMVLDIKNGLIDHCFTEEFLTNACLCLKKVKHLKINGIDMYIHDEAHKRVVKYINKYEFYKFDYTYEIKDAFIRNQRYENREADTIQKITYLVPLENRNCYIYSTFPTTQKMEVPVIVDANIKLNTSREVILKYDTWNNITINKIHDGFLWMLEQLKTIDYEKMMDIIPYDGVLTTDFSDNYLLDGKIKKLPIFKVFNTEDQFIALNDGFIAEELDRFIIRKWGYAPNKKNKSVREDCIDFDFDKITCDSFYEKPNFVDFCKDLADENSYNVIHPKYLNDDTFRNLLYEYLHSYDNGSYIESHINQDDYDEIGLKDWEIIPVLKNKTTDYVKYSKNIYYSNNPNDNISDKVLILNQNQMSIHLFDFIYYDSDPYNIISIKEYSESILLEEMVEKINRYIFKNKYDHADYLLKLYDDDTEMFKECFRRRKVDLELNDLVLITRNNQCLDLDDCYLPFEQEKNTVLDNVIVADKYVELAEILSVKSICEIDTIENLYDFFTFDNINQLFSLESLQYNTKLFNQICFNIYEYGYADYIENEVYLKLIRRVNPTDVKYARQDNLSFKRFTSSINKFCLENFDEIFKSVFKNYDEHMFILNEDIELIDFDHYDLLNDIRNELQTRKLDDKIILASSLIDHCYYFKGLKGSIIPLRLEDQNILLINDDITSEYDIVDCLKDFFLKNFSLSLSITRTAEKYTRQYFEYISTIDYNLEEEKDVTERASELDYNNFNSVKDFMCKPQHVKDKVIGGYARTCPLCGAKVHTELTGMRLYKYKDSEDIFEFICCPTCYENLRYSTDLKIDKEELKKNYLSFKAIVCGEEWKVEHVKIRLGHKAILNYLNRKK